MKVVTQVETAGGIVSFDADEDALDGVGPEDVSRDGGAVVTKLDGSLEAALASARPAAETVINTFRELSPDSVAIEFGLRIDAEAGAVFAKAGIGAHFTVTLNWNGTKQPTT